MTYLIEGQLLVEEKPAVYMGKFVEKRASVVAGITGVSQIATTHPLHAQWLSRRGHDFQYIDDIAKAETLCERKTVDVSFSKWFIPLEDWAAYLTKRFSETKEYTTIDGTFRIWNEVRVPSPWVYALALGSVDSIYHFSNGEFYKPRREKQEGTMTRWGLITPVFHVQQTHSHIVTKRSIV